MDSQIQRKWNHEQYRQLLESIPDATILVDRKGKIIFFNAAAVNLFGYSPQEITGKAIEILIPGRFKSQHQQHRFTYFKHPWTRPMGSDLELYAQCKNGQELVVAVSLSPVHTEKGIFITVFIRDMSAWKQKENQLRYQDSLTQNVSDAVITTDMNFVIKSWNKVAEIKYGWQQAEVLGRKIEDIIPTKYFHEDQETIIKQLLDKEQWIGEVIQQHKNGTFINVRASLALIKDDSGNPLGTVIVNQDITARKKAEQALQMAYDALEKQIADRTAKLNNSNQLLQTEIIQRQRAEAELRQLTNKLAQSKEQLKQELYSLEQLSSNSQTLVTAQTFGVVPLEESEPKTFNELVHRFGDLLELALEEKNYKVEHQVSDSFRALANQLGFLNADPHDVVSVYSQALRQKSKNSTSAKTNAYIEEGRMRVLQVMGYLVSYYRNHRFGSNYTSPTGSHQYLWEPNSREE